MVASSHYETEFLTAFTVVLEEVLNWSGMSRSVTKLETVHECFMRKTSQWHTLLRALPALDTVEVAGPAAAYLFRALHAYAASPSTSECRAFELETVIMNNVGPRVIAMLFRTLDQRVEQSLPRLKLHLFECEIDFATLVQLRLHQGVASVDWDGQQEGTLYYDDDDEEGEEDEDEDSGSE